MTRRWQLTALIPLVFPITSCGERGEFSSQAERGSYAIGLDMGASLSHFRDEIDVAALIEGLTDTLTGREPRLTQQEAVTVMQEFATTLRERASTRRDALTETNLAKGEAFLAENKGKDGVVTTESGLQYEVLQPGTGATPTADDRVTVHYRGTLLDGTEFDSSYERGEPAAFEVGKIIPGWTEALQLMKVGAKYRLFIPPPLAYGENGAGDVIGPNATLIFEVELLGIE